MIIFDGSLQFGLSHTISYAQLEKISSIYKKKRTDVNTSLIISFLPFSFLKKTHAGMEIIVTPVFYNSNGIKIREVFVGVGATVKKEIVEDFSVATSVYIVSSVNIQHRIHYITRLKTSDVESNIFPLFSITAKIKWMHISCKFGVFHKLKIAKSKELKLDYIWFTAGIGASFRR